MTHKFKVGDRVQVIRDSKIEIDTITFKDGTIYQLQDKSWVEDCRLAPAPALVKVPQNVKEQIELALHYNQQNKENALEGLLQDYYIRTEYESESVGEWIANNFAKFISAVLGGYEVEKEPLYKIVIVDGEDRQLLFGEDEYTFQVRYESESHESWKKRYSEREIKDIDTEFGTNYWAFAVQVEEGEG
ncbi:DUF1642 domain-containing protein [Listeria booriae]|uniref:DUF1642 domain-containing protein n=1 Tax=Listeria booriae TaxID=1552123 RepID=A0A842EXH4_9LIST|nr:DUF1642 domain-containing protein [Listeria booriae]MBC2239783.1 DUF1642 domain-containing protein [Listeria booriae]